MAGVSMLDNLHVVDQLCFGSEYGEISAMQRLAAVTSPEEQEYRVLLKTFERGLSFPMQGITCPGKIFQRSSSFWTAMILMVFWPLLIKSSTDS